MQALAARCAHVRVGCAPTRRAAAPITARKVALISSSSSRSPSSPTPAAVRFAAVAPSTRRRPRSSSSSNSIVVPSATPAAAAAADDSPLSEETFTLRRIAWASFWTQLSLSIVSAVVLFFTAAQSRPGWAAAAAASSSSSSSSLAIPPLPFLCTALGVAGALLSTALAFGLTRVTRSVLVRGETVKRSAVVAGALAAVRLNLWATGAALVGLQATVGSLVSGTLLTATQNPFAAGGAAAARAAAAPVALDVFAVQASSNVLLAHFASIVFATWLIRVISRAPASRGPPRRRRREEEEYEFSLPAAAGSSSSSPPKTAFEAAQDFKKGAY